MISSDYWDRYLLLVASSELQLDDVSSDVAMEFMDFLFRFGLINKMVPLPAIHLYVHDRLVNESWKK